MPRLKVKISHWRISIEKIMIHIITATHNRKKITLGFVKCIRQQSYRDTHLILIDDGSVDGTPEMVLKEFPNTTIIRGNGNLWWGGALHQAYLWLKDNLADIPDDIVLFSNDDVSWDVDYLQKGLDAVLSHSRTLIIGKGYGNLTGKLIDRVYIRDYTGDKGGNPRKGPLVASDNGRGECCSTRSLFCRVKDVLEIGGFHPVLLPHYGSDFEWTIRASRKGYAIIQMDNMSYYLNEEATGNHGYEGLSIRQLFSRKSDANPIYRFNFLFLTTPLRYIPVEVYRQLARYLIKISLNKRDGRGIKE